MVIVGFVGNGWLPICDLARIAQNGKDTCIVVDPWPDLDRALTRIKASFGDGPWIRVLGIGRLDLADASAYQTLLKALEDRCAHRILTFKQRNRARAGRNRQSSPDVLGVGRVACIHFARLVRLANHSTSGDTS